MQGVIDTIDCIASMTVIESKEKLAVGSLQLAVKSKNMACATMHVGF